MIPFMPHTPKAISEHRDRLKKALEPLFDPELIQFSGAIRPGETPDNIFDFDDGMRMIISRDRLIGEKDGVIHMSASASRGSELYKKIETGEMLQFSFCGLACQRIADIFGKRCECELLGFSNEKSVPHFIVTPNEDTNDQRT